MTERAYAEPASTDQTVVEVKKADKSDDAARLRLAVRRLFGDLTFAFQTGQRQRIQQLLVELNKVAPASPENAYFQGLAAYRDGDRIKAVQWLRRAVDLNPEFDPAWNVLGMIMLDAERFDEAASAFLRAESANAYDPHYPYNAAAAMFSVKNLKACGEQAQRALDLKPNFSEAAYLKAMCLLEAGNVEGSLAIFETALKDNRRAPEWTADYLRAADKAGKESIIVKLLETGIEEQPAATRTAAGVYLRYGDYERSLRLYDRVLRSGTASMGDRMAYIRCARRLSIDPKAAWIGLTEIDRKTLDDYDRNILSKRVFGARDSIMNPAK
ncbi:MAG: tetratricopeptide repeat protein [Spirochaetia bacterium]|nr:tetratricopeptide repeat protein [Spirochaetia bacterium]